MLESPLHGFDVPSLNRCWRIPAGQKNQTRTASWTYKLGRRNMGHNNPPKALAYLPFSIPQLALSKIEEAEQQNAQAEEAYQQAVREYIRARRN